MDRLTKTILSDLKNKILNKYELVEMRLKCIPNNGETP